MIYKANYNALFNEPEVISTEEMIKLTEPIKLKNSTKLQHTQAYNKWLSSQISVVGEHKWVDGQRVVEGVDYELRQNAIGYKGEDDYLTEPVAIPIKEIMNQAKPDDWFKNGLDSKSDEYGNVTSVPVPDESPVASHSCTSSNSIEHLLKPRYKVIADYPDSLRKVGEIIECKPPANNFFDGELFLAKYPHLFKRLEWWEERTEDEMPEYIKFTKDYVSFKEGAVYRTCPNWSEEPTECSIFFVYDEKAEYGKAGIPGYHNPCMPATKEEYEAFLLTNQSK